MWPFFLQYITVLLSLVTPKTRQYVTYSELSDERSTTTTTRATSNQSEALRRVRELQQGQTDEMAKVAAQERKKKAEEERKRKNLVAKRRDEWKENGGSGEADHDTDYAFSRSRNSSFNPMQPWSSGTGAGYRYVVFASNRAVPRAPPESVDMAYHPSHIPLLLDLNVAR